MMSLLERHVSMAAAHRFEGLVPSEWLIECTESVRWPVVCICPRWCSIVVDVGDIDAVVELITTSFNLERHSVSTSH